VLTQPVRVRKQYVPVCTSIHSFSFIELLNRGRHSALWKWRPRYDGRRFRARLWIDLVYLVLLLLTAGPLNHLPYPSPNP
jgi:hypothetical protein